MNLYLHLGRGEVGNVLGLDLPFLDGFRDTLAQGVYGLGVGELTDDQRLVVELLDLCSHLQHTTPLTVVVFADINATACGEVGIQHEALTFQVGDSGFADFIVVMGEDLRTQSYGNTFCSLGQQQRVFGRKGDGFLVPSVVAQLPLGGLGIEYHVKGKLRQSCLNISGSRGTVACEDISPVTLTVNQQVFLS